MRVILVIFYLMFVGSASSASYSASAPTNPVFLTGDGVKGKFAPFAAGINCVFDSVKLSDGRVIPGPAVGRFNKATGLVEFFNAGCWLEPGVSVVSRHAWAVAYYKKSLALVPDMLVAPTSTATVTRTATATRTAMASRTATATRTAMASRTTTATRTATITRTAAATPTPLAELPSDWQSKDVNQNGVRTFAFKAGSLVWAYEIITPPPGFGLEGKKNVLIDIQKDVTLTVSQGAARFGNKIPLWQVGKYLKGKYGYEFTLVTIK